MDLGWRSFSEKYGLGFPLTEVSLIELEDKNVSSYNPDCTDTFKIPNSDDFLPAKEKYKLSFIIYSPAFIKKRADIESTPCFSTYLKYVETPSNTFVNIVRVPASSPVTLPI